MLLLSEHSSCSFIAPVVARKTNCAVDDIVIVPGGPGAAAQPRASTGASVPASRANWGEGNYKTVSISRPLLRLKPPRRNCVQICNQLMDLRRSVASDAPATAQIVMRPI